MAEEEQEPEPDLTFAKEVRRATRDVHKISGLMVNAKFAFALSDDTVWADGILAFYEIFKYLENNLPEDLLPKEVHRTAAFEKDLDYFFGKDWRTTTMNDEPRESVKKYLSYMENVNKKSKVLLFAYAYHNYLALMSGGQILQKKRMIARKLWIGKKGDTASLNLAVDFDPDNVRATEQVTICPDGCAVTYFPDKIYKLKNKLRRILNEKYENFDAKAKAEFIEESRHVFEFNDDILRSIKGVNRVSLRKLAIILFSIIVIYLALKFAVRR